MIKYFEYLYLVVAVGLAAFLATSYKDLETTHLIALVVGTMIASFMYSFRRKQRQILEAQEAKRIQQLREEAGEDGT